MRLRKECDVSRRKHLGSRFRNTGKHLAKVIYIFRSQKIIRLGLYMKAFAAVMLDDPEEKKCPSISVDYRSYNSMTGKIYFELVVCWVDHRYEESGDIDIPDSLKRVIGNAITSEDELNDILFAYSKHVTKHYENRFHQNPDGFREAYGPTL